jgi:hypothetical protein
VRRETFLLFQDARARELAQVAAAATARRPKESLFLFNPCLPTKPEMGPRERGRVGAHSHKSAHGRLALRRRASQKSRELQQLALKFASAKRRICVCIRSVIGGGAGGGTETSALLRGFQGGLNAVINGVNKFTGV